MSHKKCRKGFTLLEVLVALFIFTIIAVIMTSALHNILNIQAETEKHASRINELQMTFLLMSRDIEQTIDRPITNAKGMKESAFVGAADQLAFTHGGMANPEGQLQRSTLQRVSYHLENGKLIRETWNVLDQVPTTHGNSRTLLNAVTEMRIEYLDQNGIFRHSWPAAEQTNSPPLPRGVRISLTLEKWGKITQFYVISGQAFGT
ncbi:MAG: type II secretion system minor pseudopilin GspJ [Gammaproteobacteria bacterium]|nr:type II secretion system minor pseudopilin GspJ [Gammaproteobacteria bacterium]